MTQPNQPYYRCYLLRCWAETGAGGEVVLWRFSLEDPHSGQRRGFANLTELVIALHSELFEDPARDESRGR